MLTDRADRVITLADRAGAEARAELLGDLEAVDRILAARLRGLASPESYTAADAAATRAQAAQVTRIAQERLGGVVSRTSRRAVERGVRATAETLEELDRVFVGVARPLRLRQASVLSTVVRGTEASLLRQHATSVDRYGIAMIGEIETILRQGLLANATREEMRAALIGIRGPHGEVSMRARAIAGGVQRITQERIEEGLFVRYRAWAERIVRTETARAYNASRHEAMLEQSREFPEMRRKILATFDRRTAPDSIAVHGQIREMHEPFVDGAGRIYMFPPARPNDRETVVPWMPDYRETEYTRPRSEEERAVAERAARGVRPPAPAPIRPSTITPPVAVAATARAPAQRAPSVPPWYRVPPSREAVHGPALTPAEARAALGRALVALAGDPTNEAHQLAARQAVRGHLRSAGLLSRDAVEGRAGSGRLLGGLVGGGALHQWDGRIEMAPDYMAALLEAGRDLAAGRVPTSERAARAVRVLIHEELHGVSALSVRGDGYRREGVWIEESMVDLRAIHEADRLFGRPMRYGAGAYDAQIDGMRRYMPRAYVERVLRARVTPGATERDVIDEALRTTWQRVVQTTQAIDTPEEYMRAMADALPDATDEERAEWGRGMIEMASPERIRRELIEATERRAREERARREREGQR